MSWYMDRKIPHVLGHEVCGRVIESQSERFKIGSRVFPHHHAPCLRCEHCLEGRHVHCEQWKRTRLMPGGMADLFAVAEDNLSDTWIVDDLRAVDAALIEPLACVVKSIRSAGKFESAAVIGLGVMGLMHLLLLPEGSKGSDLNPARVEHGKSLGLNASLPTDSVQRADAVFVCPGSQAAFLSAYNLVKPGGTIVMFAPLPPGETLLVPQDAYFHDLRIASSYSCGPDDTHSAICHLREGKLRAEQVCSDFIELGELPDRYKQMKAGEILKPMVVWN